MSCCTVTHIEAFFSNGALIHANNNLHQQLVEVNDANAQVAHLHILTSTVYSLSCNLHIVVICVLCNAFVIYSVQAKQAYVTVYSSVTCASCALCCVCLLSCCYCLQLHEQVQDLMPKAQDLLDLQADYAQARDQVC
jgi:hypothetical protein